MPSALYYYKTEDGTIHQYQVNISEVFLVSILARIGRKELSPSVHDLPDDITLFYFPSGRIWHANGNRFVAQKPLVYREVMLTFRRLQGIKESKDK